MMMHVRSRQARLGCSDAGSLSDGVPEPMATRHIQVRRLTCCWASWQHAKMYACGSMLQLPQVPTPDFMCCRWGDCREAFRSSCRNPADSTSSCNLEGLPEDLCEGRIASFGAAKGDAAHICGRALQCHPQRCHCGCCSPAAVTNIEHLAGCHAPCRAAVSICWWPTSHSM